MPDTAVQDDARDALALIRACLEGDTEAAEAIHDNCDLGGVVAILCGLLAEALVQQMGEDGARAWLGSVQRQES